MIMSKQRRSGLRSGFTLIEMLVVVAIIAILASLLAQTLTRALSLAEFFQCLGWQICQPQCSVG